MKKPRKIGERTVNQVLQDIAIRHGVAIERLKGSEVRRILRILARADEAALNKLQRRLERLGPIELQTFGNGRAKTERLVAVRNAINGIADDAALIFNRDLADVLFDVAKEEAAFQSDSISRVIKLKTEWVRPSNTLLRSVVRSRPFGGLILREHTREWGRAKRRAVLGAVRTGIILGESIPDVVRRVRGTRARGFRDGAMQASRNSAERIVRTSIAHVTNTARAEIYEANADILKGTKWTAVLDTRTCPECGSLDGKVFAVSSGRRPPAHFSCRCVMTPVLKSGAGTGVRVSSSGDVPEDLEFNDWLRGQPAAVQNESLGPTRAKLFRGGKLDMDGFIDKRGNVFTLDDLRKTNADAFKRAGFE